MTATEKVIENNKTNKVNKIFKTSLYNNQYVECAK